jgi:hypothetical protein
LSGGDLSVLFSYNLGLSGQGLVEPGDRSAVSSVKSSQGALGVAHLRT